MHKFQNITHGMHQPKNSNAGKKEKLLKDGNNYILLMR